MARRGITAWWRGQAKRGGSTVRMSLLLLAFALPFALLLAGCQANAGAWQVLSAPTDADTIALSLAADPFVPQLIYAGTSTGQVMRLRVESLGEVPGSGIATNAAVSIVLPDPAHKGVVYAGTSNGIYRSSDFGDSWHALGTGLPQNDGEDALALGAASGSGPAPLFAGTEQHGVYASHDDGATWAASNAGLPSGASIYSLTYDAANATLYAALVGQGIYASTDGGAHWTARAAGLPAGVDAFTVLLLPHSGTAPDTLPDTLYAGTSKGAFASTDGGQTWHAGGLNQTRVIALARDPSVPGALYAGTSNAENSAGSVYRTTDGGAHWSEVAPGLAHAVAAVVVAHLAKQQPLVLAAAGHVYRYPALGGGSTTFSDVAAIVFVVLLVGFAWYFFRRTRRQMAGLPGFEPRSEAGPGSGANSGGGAGSGKATRPAARHGPRVTATGAIIPTREEIERGQVKDGGANGQTRGSSSPWRDQPAHRDDADHSERADEN